MAAYDYAECQLTDGFPLSIRLITATHAKLLASGHGRTQCPGEFRRSQNWIGGSRPGNAREVTGATYGRLYAYDSYLAILAEGSEAIH